MRAPAAKGRFPALPRAHDLGHKESPNTTARMAAKCPKPNSENCRTDSTAARADGAGKMRINIKKGRFQMKKMWIAVALALLAGCAKKAPEPVVNLSGFELGGSAEQVLRGVPNWKSITIGGVPSYFVHLGPSAEFGTDNRLRSLMFLFNSTSFSQVVGNVSSKYPGLACKDSRGSHPNGSASFDQTVCSMRVKGGELVIQRVYGDVGKSVLTLKSDAVIAEEKEGATKRLQEKQK